MAALFGFSVGDFIAAIELVTKVANSLRDSGDAKPEYQRLARDLTNLLAALSTINSPQSNHNASIATSVHDQTLLIQQTAQELLDKIHKFERPLGSGSAAGWHHGTGRKVQWAAFSQKITKLRDVLEIQVQNLAMLNGLQIL
jgi:hypothetical protein